MARKKEQTARRHELREAAGRAIVRRGVLNVRIKDVAAEAGISEGLVRYYYADLEELLVELHEHSVDRFYWARMEALRGHSGADERLAALVAEGLPRDAEDQLCVILYELHLLAARNRTHAALMTSLWDREVSLYAAVLQEGMARGELALRQDEVTVASTAVALEDAFGLHIVARNGRLDAARGRALLLSYLADATGVAPPEMALPGVALPGVTLPGQEVRKISGGALTGLGTGRSEAGGVRAAYDEADVDSTVTVSVGTVPDHG